jgi:hypothetical protein
VTWENWPGDQGGVILMKTSLLRSVGVIVVALSLNGCATTTPIVSEWRNPAYSSASFKRIMIGGIGGETSVRRNFEDEFVFQLRAVGVDAVPSYRYVAEGEKIDETQLKQIAQKAGADATLFARSINVEQKTQLGPSYPMPWFGVFGSNVGATWQGSYGAPSVSRYTEYTSETTLHDVAKNDVVWTGTIKTTEPENVRTGIKNYVEAVVKALQAKSLLPKRE